MASVTLKLQLPRKRSEVSVDYPLVFQVVHDRKKRFIPTPFTLKEEEWNPQTQTAANFKASKVRSAYLKEVNVYIYLQKKQINSLIASMGDDESYTVDDIVSAYKRNKDNRRVFPFIRQLVMDLKMAGKPGTAYNYNSTFNTFCKFRGGEDLYFPQLNYGMVKDFENYLFSSGLATNTVCFYMRNLRSIYNKAIAKGIVSEHLYPFKRVTIKTEKTVKRAIDKELIYKLKVINLKHNPKLEWAHDLFLFSFYTRGMSFVDMAYLKISNIKGDKIYYNRHKTRQLLQITLTSQIVEIINKYKAHRDSSGYLLPILKNDPWRSEYMQYKSALRVLNENLKSLGRLVSSPVPLSSYVARHSWATIAKKQGIPLSVISEGMGHNSESTTRIYLAAFDTSVIDQANDIVTNL